MPLITALVFLLSLLISAVGVLAIPSAPYPDESEAPRSATLTLEEIRRALDAPGAHEPFVPAAPLGITTDLESLIPKDNPITKAKVELGRQLYFEPRLSRDATVSCATCHSPAKGWSDGLPVSTGIGAQKGDRSAPTIVNRALAPVQFWDGRAASLEEQAVGPVGNPIEMGFDVAKAAERLAGIPGYRIQFEKIFGGGPTADRVAKAIASFERTVLTGASPNDWYVAALPYLGSEPEAGDTAEDLRRRDDAIAGAKKHPLSAAAARGRELFFNKAQCSLCHVGDNFSDEQFHNLGVGMDRPAFDAGREKHTKKESDRGAFRTPTVRDVALTAPYMHDGSLKTLLEVVEHYDKGGIPNRWLDPKVRKLGLTPQEKSDLVAFMEQGLTGVATPVEVPRLP